MRIAPIPDINQYRRSNGWKVKDSIKRIVRFLDTACAAALNVARETRSTHFVKR
ncbi:hypothetical protein BRPE64_BCDS13570 [Caballeronia insecticola]|uniref:Uncharacterized protein n=1 Tax=Caballeronia insecticola TaxID=758793 RepID=R4WN03_9BURK|nr:hypothetical protein BRPE64_BCDS13570 [Caballeronia insecticola]